MLETLRNLPPWLRSTLVFPLLFLNGFLLALLLNYLHPLVYFVIIATILAFVLELGVDFLTQKGIKRGIAIALLLLVTLFLLTILSFILIPLIIEQLGQLINTAPQWIAQTNQQLENLSDYPLFERFAIDINAIILKINEQFAKILEDSGGKVLNLIGATISSLLNILLILVLTIFSLTNGQSFWQGIFSYFPEPWNEKIPRYTKKTFKDYFLARLILTVISATARWILFLLVGLPYSALFGFGFGFAGFIPLLGTVLSLLGFVILSFKGIEFGLKFLVISFILDQISDNVLAPRIMGNAIGLNPIWLIVSLFIGAKIGGILGLFLAVPVASIIKQIVHDLRTPVDQIPEIPETPEPTTEN
ncbi:AI-2E family transporter [Gloeocapsa sp. PCC 73106]|uniref:AI-2E family transporter n=1 Tax=Gloeocapsa sp. PCC 73106 TaxID=102232 RepID=UPI0002AC70CC|nr:AI-2E family transporter [Gloeocapsa sp. PCC 73106]ELR98055.1 putative permease [Gloeocapsa sp. PCC 73106]